MVSIKILLLLTVVTIVACTPTPHHERNERRQEKKGGCHKSEKRAEPRKEEKKEHGEKKKCDKKKPVAKKPECHKSEKKTYKKPEGHNQKGGGKKKCDKNKQVANKDTYTGGSGLAGFLRFAFKVIKGDIGIRNANIDNILKIKLPGAITGAFDFSIKLTRGFGALIEYFLKGVGSLLERIIVVIFKNLLCLKGFLGLKKHSICKPAFDKQFGVNVQIMNYDGLLKGYKLVNAKVQLDALIKKHSGNKGLQSLKGSKLVVLRTVSELIKLLKKKNLSNQDFTVVLGKIITIFGSILESFKAKLGVQVVNEYFKVFVYIFKKHNIDVSVKLKSVLKIVEGCKNDNAPWPRYRSGKKYSNPYLRDGNKDTTVATPVLSTLPDALHYLFRGCKNTLYLKEDFITPFLNIKPLKVYQDVIETTVKIVEGIGGIVESFAKGLGQLIVRIIIVPLKAKECNYLSDTDSDTSSAICKLEFDKKFGVTRKAKDYDDLRRLYKVDNADTQLQVYIDDFSDGRGINALYGYLKPVFGTVLDIVNILKKGTDDTTILYKLIIELIGLFGNGLSPKLGEKIVNLLVPKYDKFLNNRGISIGDYKTDIVNKLKNCDCEDAPWRRYDDGSNSQKTNDDNSSQSNDDSDEDISEDDTSDSIEETNSEDNKNGDIESTPSAEDSSDDTEETEQSTSLSDANSDTDNSDDSSSSDDTNNYTEQSDDSSSSDKANKNTQQSQKSFSSDDTNNYTEQSDDSSYSDEASKNTQQSENSFSSDDANSDTENSNDSSTSDEANKNTQQSENSFSSDDANSDTEELDESSSSDNGSSKDNEPSEDKDIEKTDDLTSWNDASSNDNNESSANNDTKQKSEEQTSEDEETSSSKKYSSDAQQSNGNKRYKYVLVQSYKKVPIDDNDEQ